MAQLPTRLKRGDRSPEFRATLRDRDGDPIDLTGSTLRFLMRDANDVTNTVINAAAIIVDAVNGIMRYPWGVGETDTPGKFEAEVEITFAGGLVETVPNVGFHEVIIEQDIA